MTIAPINTAFLICMLASPLMAQDPLTGEEFEAYTTGKTLFFGQGGAPYGAEQYLGNRRVRWSFLDGQCQEGQWYPQDGNICFVYEDNPEPQCWSFTLGTGGLIARFTSDSSDQTLYEAQDLGQDMVCLGPDVGV